MKQQVRTAFRIMAMFFILRSGFWLMIVYSSIFRIDIAAPLAAGKIDFGGLAERIAPTVAVIAAQTPSLCEKSQAACTIAAASAAKLVADQAAPVGLAPPARRPFSQDTLKAADRDLLPPRRPAKS